MTGGPPSEQDIRVHKQVGIIIVVFMMMMVMMMIFIIIIIIIIFIKFVFYYIEKIFFLVEYRSEVKNNICFIFKRFLKVFF